jgi:hypothetical protein
MRIRLSELRRIIRETVEEAMVDEAPIEEDEFTFAIAKAAEKGEKTADVGGEKFPVKMSKEKAKQITGNKQQKK